MGVRAVNDGTRSPHAVYFHYAKSEHRLESKLIAERCQALYLRGARRVAAVVCRRNDDEEHVLADSPREAVIPPYVQLFNLDFGEYGEDGEGAWHPLMTHVYRAIGHYLRKPLVPD
jgi:hypothetical protein